MAEGLDHDGEDIPPVLFASVILLDRARCLPASYVSLIICAYSPHGAVKRVITGLETSESIHDDAIVNSLRDLARAS